MLFFCGQRWIRQAASGKPSTGRFSDPPFRIHFFMRNKKSNILFRILLNSWWAEMDSNHRTLTRTDLQSAAFSHSGICPFSHLKNNKWCTLKDSNLGPTGYEPVALTNWAKGPLQKTSKMLVFWWVFMTASIYLPRPLPTNWAKGAFLNALRSIQYFWIDVNTFFEKT